jgi:predicted RNase H-like HicB family nuclease
MSNGEAAKVFDRVMGDTIVPAGAIEAMSSRSKQTSKSPARGKDAKPYQVRQLRSMIEEFGLKLWGAPTVHYTIIVFWSDDDASWVADVPDLKSCSAFGDTPEEAVVEVRAAMDAWLAAARDAGHPIPEARYQPQHEAAE